MCISTPSCSAKQSAEIQTALLQAITGLTQLVSQLATQFPTQPAAADAEPWMEERGVVPATHRCSNDLSPILDELSVGQLRSMLRNYPIDRRSLPAPIERLRRSELIEALNQIQAMDL
jgi:hypothetical protein